MVDCQWACPAHTPVPEYIRLIAEGRYSDAYMINWKSNVFPGILGRTCDRPCEPACRRGRVEETPVAICRLKRVAADFKDDIKHRLPRPGAKNGKRIALVGGGPASLTVARDLAPLGYQCTVFDADPKAGGMMRSQIPKFRLPDSVIKQETDYILNIGIEFKGGARIASFIGATTGFVIGITSAGSGTVIAILLIAVFRLAPKKVVGTDVFHAAILLWAAGIAHWIGGNVDFTLAANILIGSVPGVIIGAALSDRAPQGFIRTALGLVLVGSGIVTIQKGDPTVWPIAAGVAALGLGLILAAPHWLNRRRAASAGDLASETSG